jgi:hypothetical protein
MSGDGLKPGPIARMFWPQQAVGPRPREEAARLAQVIREAVTAHEEDGAAQWYVDEFTIDCDAERFWQVVEQAIRDDGR